MQLNNPFHFDYTDGVILKDKLCPVSVGTVTTGVPYSEAAVTATQKEDEIVLDFTIPRGADGSQVEANTIGLDTFAEKDGFFDNQTAAVHLSVDGETAAIVPTPGLYRKASPIIVVGGDTVTLRSNFVCRHMGGIEGGRLKILLDEDHNYALPAWGYDFHNRYRIFFHTGKKSEPEKQIATLHLPASVAVPKGWAGRASEWDGSYLCYDLMPDTLYDVIIDHLGADCFLLSCNVDHSAPLTVTGVTDAVSVPMSDGKAYALFTVPTLSHTPKEIYDAFSAGREVNLRLTGITNAMTIGSSAMPYIKDISARVTAVGNELIRGGYYVDAVGDGSSLSASAFYRVVISYDQGKEYATIDASLYRRTAT
jgi:hypothetical protein